MNPVQDLRGKVPPEPMEIILDALENAAPGEELAFILPHFPAPLIPLLEGLAAAWRSELLADGGLCFYVVRA